jgi:hypothetical protein
MARERTRFDDAPERSGTWLVRERASGGLVQVLVPPGTRAPRVDAEGEPLWTLWSWVEAEAELEDGAPHDCRVLTVREAVRFARRNQEQIDWVYERSVLYAQHLLTLTVEHSQHDRSLSQDVATVFLDPAIVLLEQVHDSAGDDLPVEIKRLAIDGLPELVLPKLGVSEQRDRLVAAVDSVR